MQTLKKSCFDKKNMSKKINTKICLENISNNKFIANKRYLHGYDVEQLMLSLSPSQAILCLFTGNIPNAQHTSLFEKLIIALMNLGPRFIPIRAAMTAGISKSNVENLLPIGLLSVGREGASDLESAYLFIKENHQKNVNKALMKYWHCYKKNTHDVFLGFGSRYGEPDPLLNRILNLLYEACPDSVYLKWCTDFSRGLSRYNLGPFEAVIVAAVCLELNIGQRESVGIMQYIISPGIITQAIEQTHHPISQGALLGDDQYEYIPKK